MAGTGPHCQVQSLSEWRTPRRRNPRAPAPQGGRPAKRAPPYSTSGSDAGQVASLVFRESLRVAAGDPRGRVRVETWCIAHAHGGVVMVAIASRGTGAGTRGVAHGERLGDQTSSGATEHAVCPELHAS